MPYLLLNKARAGGGSTPGLLAIPFLVLVILVQPVWIDPLFNKFGPMKNKALEAKILALAERAGIEGGRVYEVAKSEDTKVLNAYVTGFGDTKRIVLWDTTIAKLDEQELLFVMGHEMGHYVLGHVWKMILFFAAVIMVTLYAIHRTAGWLIGRYQHRFGFSELSDVASLPLISCCSALYLFVVTPGVLAFTRCNEHESDRFGLEITREQPRCGHGVRQAAAGEPGRPAPALAGQAVAGEPSDARRAHRLLQRISPVGTRGAVHVQATCSRERSSFMRAIGLTLLGVVLATTLAVAAGKPGYPDRSSGAARRGRSRPAAAQSGRGRTCSTRPTSPWTPPAASTCELREIPVAHGRARK